MLQSKIVRKEKGVKDFVLLDQISEDAFMANLKERYEDDTIYTFIGPVVVSVNPYKNINIYTAEHIELYRGREIYELPPHIFAVASDAYRDMSFNKRNQCIIISGESGAGKTEASKHIMQYIAAVSGVGRSEVNRVKDQLLKSNPVLEAFGNACTNRNDNSSRFGKYMDIQFIFNGDPVGGRISNYLLEKSRVVHQAKGERNFHIFYQMFSSGLISGKPEDYSYLNQSGVIKVKTIDDEKDYKVVMAAMKVIGFSESEISGLFNIVAAVINMGNIQFDKLGDGSAVSEGSKNALAQTAKFMGATPDSLATALTQRTVATGRDVTKATANVEQANYSRDAFAKSVYNRAFSWLVQRINQSILYTPKYGEDLTVIGVLDIYGFEIFEINSFEQFCINYCNEKLQQLFIELTLKTEQEEYMNEGIQWEEVKYFNNAIICEMIDMSNTGMIALLDEECLRPGDASDTTFLDKLNTRFKTHNHYESRETNRSDKNLTDKVFRIKHYAGDVTYNVTNFLDKNTDSLFKDLKQAAYNSTNAILKEIFADGASINEASKRPLTSGTSFKNSLAELVANLKTKNPHYIRCIKPNSKKAAGVFEPELCLHQVRYLGLLENVRVRRAGFAYRQTYEKWFGRFKILSKSTFPTFKGTPREGVQLICRDMKLTDNDYRMGKTKVFIRSPQTLVKFEEAREQVFPKMATLIQKIWKGYKARRAWAKLRAAIKIQLKWRNYKSKKYFIVLFKTFEGIRTAPNYGFQIKCPPNPPLLDRFVLLLRKIHMNWRARQIVMKLSPTEQLYVRKKIFTSGIFRGKKPWPINKNIVGDYIGNEPVVGPAFNAAKPRILAAHGSKTVRFAAIVTKCNRSGSGQPRGLVLTDKGLYKTDPKNFQIKKAPGWALGQVNGISLSSRKDAVVVVHMSGGFDLVADLGMQAGGDKAAEFVVELVQAVMKNGGQRPPVTFSDSIQCDANNQKKTLTFQASPRPPQPPQTVFKKTSGTAWVALCVEL